MLSEALRKEAELRLSRAIGKSVIIEKMRHVGGGDINFALELSTTEGRFFMKHNSSKRFPKMFELEAEGLNRIRLTNTVNVPEVITWGHTAEEGFLILEFLEHGHRSSGAMEELGRQLAMMHRFTSEKFGYPVDNYIGSLVQTNEESKGWCEFFILYRLEPMIKQASRKGLLDQWMIKAFDNLFRKLPQIVPEEPPALLHGDLWGGNYLIASNGKAYLIDPAVYFGHREIDLAMTKLFGGFPEEFYREYHNTYPLNPGWNQRLEIHNLYPLLVHVNLFGGGYVSSVAATLRQFR